MIKILLIFRHKNYYVGHNRDRKSTRLNSSHVATSYAVFCLKKKKKRYHPASNPPPSPVPQEVPTQLKPSPCDGSTRHTTSSPCSRTAWLPLDRLATRLTRPT